LSVRLLDTDTVVELVRANKASVTDRYVAALMDGIALSISTVSVFEFRYGLERSAYHAAQEPAFERLLTRLAVAPFDEADANRTAQLKADLAAQGRMIGAYDLLIAGQALARGWTMVTSNRREFSRVDGLTLEDWSAAA
jgi:tRNA(fMet)-specific endonuclease VapC